MSWAGPYRLARHRSRRLERLGRSEKTPYSRPSEIEGCSAPRHRAGCLVVSARSGGHCIQDPQRLVRARLAGATNPQTQRARCLPDCTDHSLSKVDLSTHRKAVAARRKTHGTVALPSPIQTCLVQSMSELMSRDALAYCRYGFDNREITIEVITNNLISRHFEP